MADNEDDKRFTVPPGEKVTIELEEIGEGLTNALISAVGGAGRSVNAGLLPTGYVEDDIYARPRPVVTLYDLGNRLQSLSSPSDIERAFIPNGALAAPERDDSLFNRYLPLQMEVTGTNPAPNVFRVAQEEIAAIDQRLLGIGEEFNPFGKTPANGSGRMVSNVMPLPFTFDPGAVSDNFIFLFLGETLYIVGAAPSFPGHEEDWKKREPGEGDSTERWATYSLQAGVAQETGFIKPKERVKGGVSVGVQRGFYYSFDTADTEGFKVTEEPDYGAEEVSRLNLNVREIGIYLKPAFYTHIVTLYAELLPIVDFEKPLSSRIWFVGRVPTYFRFPSHRELGNVIFTNEGFGRVLGQYVMRVPHVAQDFPRVSADYKAYFNRHDFLPENYAGGLEINQGLTSLVPVQSNSLGLDNHVFTHTGTLAGAIRAGSRVYYVWHKADFVNYFLSGEVWIDPTPTGLIV